MMMSNTRWCRLGIADGFFHCNIQKHPRMFQKQTWASSDLVLGLTLVSEYWFHSTVISWYKIHLLQWACAETLFPWICAAVT
jgi:hypothetical protein